MNKHYRMVREGLKDNLHVARRASDGALEWAAGSWAHGSHPVSGA